MRIRLTVLAGAEEAEQLLQLQSPARIARLLLHDEEPVRSDGDAGVAWLPP
jgi:hypothetical protein